MSLYFGGKKGIENVEDEVVENINWACKVDVTEKSCMSKDLEEIRRKPYGYLIRRNNRYKSSESETWLHCWRKSKEASVAEVE